MKRRSILTKQLVQKDMKSRKSATNQRRSEDSQWSVGSLSSPDKKGKSRASNESNKSLVTQDFRTEQKIHEAERAQANWDNRMAKHSKEGPEDFQKRFSEERVAPRDQNYASDESEEEDPRDQKARQHEVHSPTKNNQENHGQNNHHGKNHDHEDMGNLSKKGNLSLGRKAKK